mgnify:CR=1 FL=1|tara:strand:- start:14058 stop:14414 length:357 start_codon:yes stop_codon:yes gene_type:complete
MNELKRKGNALPDWIADNFHSGQIVDAIKRNQNPDWIKGGGETLSPPIISKQKYSWSELRRTPKGILAVLAWELGIRKADFKDATSSKLSSKNGQVYLEKTNRFNEIMLSAVSVDEEE